MRASTRTPQTGGKTARDTRARLSKIRRSQADAPVQPEPPAPAGDTGQALAFVFQRHPIVPRPREEQDGLVVLLEFPNGRKLPQQQLPDDLPRRPAIRLLCETWMNGENENNDRHGGPNAGVHIPPWIKGILYQRIIIMKIK
jgi:hypothetical protein